MFPLRLLMPEVPGDYTTLAGFVAGTFRMAFDARAWRAGLRALRAPSLVIAAFSCGLGIAIAFRDGAGDWINAAAVMAAGLALQAGVNLVNDYFEFRQRRVEDKAADLGFTRDDRDLLETLVFLVGLAFFGAAGLIGLFVSWRSGWWLVAVGITGFAGGFFYTGEPLNYKRRGLAVALVFVFMGVLMVEGAYAGVCGRFSAEVALLSVPCSLLVSLILLGNELRDHAADERHGVRTLAVRIGYPRAAAVYAALLAAAYAATLALRAAGVLPRAALVLLAVPFALPPFVFIRRPPHARRPLIPLVMLHHLAFGAVYCLSVFGVP